MKILVTGADGFVGEHLLVRLLEHGHEVTAATRSLPPMRSTLEPSDSARVDWKAAELTDHDALVRLIAAARPDQIYHLAGFASGELARRQAAEALHVNAGGTVNLCEAVSLVQSEYPSFNPRILVMGSGDAYGDAAREGEPFEEGLPLRPVSPYGLSKACQELVAHTYRRVRGMRTLVARCFSLMGRGQLGPFVVPEFCRQAAEIAAGAREPFMQVGNLDVERDFLDVRDGVDAFCQLMDLPDPEATYNVASGQPVRIGTLLDWILEAAGVEAEIRVDPDRVRPAEVQRITGDATRLRDQTGWAPRRSIEDTVKETYEWWSRRLEQMTVS
ncbi:MAG: GDP-mannose 4,6-dehydratase [Gemmatimonadota bacterium]